MLYKHLHTLGASSKDEAPVSATRSVCRMSGSGTRPLPACRARESGSHLAQGRSETTKKSLYEGAWSLFVDRGTLALPELSKGPEPQPGQYWSAPPSRSRTCPACHKARNPCGTQNAAIAMSQLQVSQRLKQQEQPEGKPNEHFVRAIAGQCQPVG